MRGLLFGLLGLAGCAHTSATVTAEHYHAAIVTCATNEAAIVQACGDNHTPNDVCRTTIAVERRRCDAELANICKHGRGCP